MLKFSICLIHTPCLELRDDRLEPPLGLLYIASSLEQQGFEVKLLDLAAVTDSNLVDLIPDHYDVYGFSTYSVNYDITLKICIELKKRNPEALMIAGGPHATALPHEVSGDGFDIVITGEGEVTVSYIMQNLSKKAEFPALMRGTPPTLDDLPFPNYDLINMNTYSRVVDGEKCVSILTSRGCPYPCAFCNSNIMGAGKAMRFRSPDCVAQEIRYIKQKYAIKHFRIQDDIYTINIKRIRELAPKIGQENIHYRCFARVNSMSDEMAHLLKESGCLHASFGVESGSPTILAKGAMSKMQTPQQIRQGLTNANKAGIASRIYLLVGFPGETDETIQETLSLLKDCPWDEFAVYPVIAYPGTPLHDRPKDFGITYIDKNYSDYLQIGKNFKAGFTIRTETFNEEKVAYWRDLMINELTCQGRTWAGDSIKFK